MGVLASRPARTAAPRETAVLRTIRQCRVPQIMCAGCYWFPRTIRSPTCIKFDRSAKAGSQLRACRLSFPPQESWLALLWTEDPGLDPLILLHSMCFICVQENLGRTSNTVRSIRSRQRLTPFARVTTEHYSRP